MKELLEKLLEMIESSDYLTTSMYVCLAMLLVVVVVHFLTRHLRFIKYIPGAAAVFIGATSMLSSLEDFLVVTEVDRMVLYGILVAAGIIGLLMAWILGIVDKEVKPRKVFHLSKFKARKQADIKKASD